MTSFTTPSALSINDEPARSAACACAPCTCAAGGQQCTCGDTPAQAGARCATPCTCATCHCA